MLVTFNVSPIVTVRTQWRDGRISNSLNVPHCQHTDRYVVHYQRCSFHEVIIELLIPSSRHCVLTVTIGDTLKVTSTRFGYTSLSFDFLQPWGPRMINRQKQNRFCATIWGPTSIKLGFSNPDVFSRETTRLLRIFLECHALSWFIFCHWIWIEREPQAFVSGLYFFLETSTIPLISSWFGYLEVQSRLTGDPEQPDAVSLAESRGLLALSTSGEGVKKAPKPRVIRLLAVWFGAAGLAPLELPKHEGGTTVQLRVDYSGCALVIEEENKSLRGTIDARKADGCSIRGAGAAQQDEAGEDDGYDQPGALTTLKYSLHDSLGSYLFIQWFHISIMSKHLGTPRPLPLTSPLWWFELERGDPVWQMSFSHQAKCTSHTPCEENSKKETKWKKKIEIKSSAFLISKNEKSWNSAPLHTHKHRQIHVKRRASAGLMEK